MMIRREGRDMVILMVIGLLTLVSLISFTLGTDDSRQRGYAPKDEVRFWTRFWQQLIAQRRV